MARSVHSRAVLGPRTSPPILYRVESSVIVRRSMAPNVSNTPSSSVATEGKLSELRAFRARSKTLISVVSGRSLLLY